MGKCYKSWAQVTSNTTFSPIIPTMTQEAIFDCFETDALLPWVIVVLSSPAVRRGCLVFPLPNVDPSPQCRSVLYPSHLRSHLPTHHRIHVPSKRTPHLAPLRPCIPHTVTLHNSPIRWGYIFWQVLLLDWKAGFIGLPE